MTYSVTIAPSAGAEISFPCGGTTDQQALIYAGKVVEANADRSDPDARVTIFKDGEAIGPIATVADMTRRAV